MLATLSKALQITETDTAVTQCSNDKQDWATWLTPNPLTHGYTLETPCERAEYDPLEDCDCIPEGTFKWCVKGSGDCFDNYFNSNEYQIKDRQVKLQEIWSQLTETDRSTGKVSPTKPKC